ncbi:hypothetical protein SUGI_0654440 [Cryptomeria japonica]|nr:hypothetical protein SUGI_0654440 [Cryptomeria japonica]
MKDRHRSALMLYHVDATMHGMIMTLPDDVYVRCKGKNREMHSAVNAVPKHKEKIRHGVNPSKRTHDTLWAKMIGKKRIQSFPFVISCHVFVAMRIPWDKRLRRRIGGVVPCNFQRGQKPVRDKIEMHGQEEGHYPAGLLREPKTMQNKSTRKKKQLELII